MPPPGGNKPDVTHRADVTMPDLTSPRDLTTKGQEPCTPKGKNSPTALGTTETRAREKGREKPWLMFSHR